MNGYGGSILHVNLESSKITRTPTPAEMARDFIGRRGFGIYTLYKEVPNGVDPLGPENKLIVSNGPFSGMLVVEGGKCDWTTKSPLTGGYASASMGGHFTAQMKYAGYDSIVLERISPKPVILLIEDDKCQLLDASAYWGKGAVDVEVALKHKYGEEYQVAAIGQGGENLVSYACINHDFGRAPGNLRPTNGSAPARSSPPIHSSFKGNLGRILDQSTVVRLDGDQNAADLQDAMKLGKGWRHRHPQQSQHGGDSVLERSARNLLFPRLADRIAVSQVEVGQRNLARRRCKQENPLPHESSLGAHMPARQELDCRGQASHRHQF